MPPVTRRAPGARALGQVGELQDAKYSLSQQVRELIDKYRQAERIVAHAKREVAGATAMMEQAMRDAERKSQSAVAKAEMRIRQVKHGAGAARGGLSLRPSSLLARDVPPSVDTHTPQVKQDSRREREYLVQQALASLNQLRSHLTVTLSGLRAEVKPDPCEALSIENWIARNPYHGGMANRMELVTRTGDTVAVRFEPPIAPLSVRPLPPSPRPRSASASSPRHGRGRPPSAVSHASVVVSKSARPKSASAVVPVSAPVPHRAVATRPEADGLLTQVLQPGPNCTNSAGSAAIPI